ncbi:MAG: formylmethanofuran dehydrogenase subunit E family protein [bacterium]
MLEKNSRFREIDDQLLKDAEHFHGRLAPGLYLGFLMVEKVLKELGNCEMIDAAAESVKCLPDSIQLMTPCTVGNGWLKVFDYGNFAITLYDKKSKEGVRVKVDLDKIPRGTLFYKWITREIEEKESDSKVVIEDIKKLKGRIFSLKRVKVQIEKEKHLPLMNCKKCGESFPVKNNAGGLCMICQGKGYWNEIQNAKIKIDEW